MRADANGRDSFDEIYEAYAELVYEKAMSYVKNHHVAEEIVQETFLKFFRFRKNTNLEAAKPWLLLTAKYAAMNYNRDTKWEYAVDGVTQEKNEKIACEGEDPEDAMIRRLREKEYIGLADDIFAALYRKNVRWYDAITITYVLEKPQKEVAELIGMDLDSFHSMLYRARKWIKDNYEHRLDEIREL